MNFTLRTEQQKLTGLSVTLKIQLLIFDNLSCLFPGLKENDADEWEKVLPWFLDFRRRRIALILVHHAGRSGFMRGTSKREDALDWLIKVEKLDDGKPQGDYEARFQTIFEKQRSGLSQSIRNWTFRTLPDHSVSCSCEELTFDAKVLELIEAGLHSATDIAAELKVNKSTVCRAAARLEKAKLIQIRSRQYHSTRYGRP